MYGRTHRARTRQRNDGQRIIRRVFEFENREQRNTLQRIIFGRIHIRTIFVFGRQKRLRFGHCKERTSHKNGIEARERFYTPHRNDTSFFKISRNLKE